MGFLYDFKEIQEDYIIDGPICECGGRDWFYQVKDSWVCSKCGKSLILEARGYITDGPSCNCGFRDWFIGKNIVRCSSCGKKLYLVFDGFLIDGPLCRCEHRDWFLSPMFYKCSFCGRMILRRISNK
jgi:DNA-directed RNA polymerase subunit RPC12/RpoP